MDGFRSPVGELPPEIYWRRRVVAIALALLVLIVLYYLVRSLFVGGDGETATTPTPTPTPSVVAVDTCDAGDLLVTVETTVRDFSGVTEPVFNVAIENTSVVACGLDTSEENAELYIRSGSDRIWSSLDCPAPLVPTFDSIQRTISPGDTEYTSVTWPRERSNEACSTSLPDPRAGTYRASVTIQGTTSEEAIFTLSD